MGHPANYLSQKGARAQWDVLNNNKNLTVHLSWDSRSSKSETKGYVWNNSWSLTSVNVSLAGKTGSSSNPVSASDGYIHGSTLNSNDAIRQAYVLAHEFAHVENADTQEGGATLRQDQQTVQHLQELLNQLGNRLYSLQPGVEDF